MNVSEYVHAPFEIPFAETAVAKARSLNLEPEMVDVSVIDKDNWVAKVGCDGCIALFLEIKNGKEVEVRQWP